MDKYWDNNEQIRGCVRRISNELDMYAWRNWAIGTKYPRKYRLFPRVSDKKEMLLLLAIDRCNKLYISLTGFVQCLCLNPGDIRSWCGWISGRFFFYQKNHRFFSICNSLFSNNLVGTWYKKYIFPSIFV